MPPKKEPAKSKAEIIKEQIAQAKLARDGAWPAFWAHRRDHVTRGANNGGTPVGYHTELLEGNGAVCMTIGEPEVIKGSNGCYKQTVTILGLPKGKSKVSTFFPTNFTINDIEAVCKSAYMNASSSQDMGKNFSAKSSANPGNGMNLHFTADSVYPEYDK